MPLSNETVDVRKLNSVMFEHFKATENTFHFSANLDFSTPGHGAPNNYYHCKVDVSSKGKLAGPVCKQIDRQTYKQEEQDEKKDQKNKDQQ
ncbi:MAG: hypothetical protein HY308_01235 [Gammaproteobacteria bacterium]|nr:hypothetical protein [Gammaproteobacteria bacterium]